MRHILTIAGSDTSAGAGVQQDLNTITAMGHYGLTVITALTAQNTMGVKDVMPTPVSMLRSQLQAIEADIDIHAVKIGMLPSLDHAQEVAQFLSRHPQVPVVLDPVMVSTSGTQLMGNDCISYMLDSLFSLCTLVTPNIPEAMRLTGHTADKIDDMGRTLSSACGTAFLIKGGHGSGDMLTETLFMPGSEPQRLSHRRLQSGNLHGTGCTLSSAIAVCLATGSTLSEAVGKATSLVQQAIEQGSSLRIGHGNGPLWVAPQK